MITFFRFLVSIQHHSDANIRLHSKFRVLSLEKIVALSIVYIINNLIDSKQLSALRFININ